MKAVRGRALREIAALKLDWGEDGVPLVAVDRSGGIVIEYDGRAQRPEGQSILDADMLDLLAPFASREGLRGPDLSVPRPRLRIVPGKLGGSPHVAHTRLESQALGALAEGGLAQEKIYRLYPDIEGRRSRTLSILSGSSQRTCNPRSQHEGAGTCRASSLSIGTSPSRSSAFCPTSKADATLVPLDRIDTRLSTLDDWELLLALHHHADPWDGLITTDSSAPACFGDDLAGAAGCRTESHPG